MLSVKNLSVRFNNHAVLKNITIDFETGLVHGIVGLNGAGKTTFFNVLAKMLIPIPVNLVKMENHLTLKTALILKPTISFFPGSPVMSI